MPSSVICVDASLVVRLLTETNDQRLPAQWQAWHRAEMPIIAPSLLYYEVTSALYQYQKHAYLTARAVEEALAAALSLPIQLYGEAGLHLLAMRFAERFALPATYDACYLALANQLEAELWSADRRLAGKVHGQLDWVHLYPG